MVFWDWLAYYRPAVLELLSGNNPHLIEGYFTPTLTLFPLIPFVLLGDIGTWLMFFTSLLSIAFVLWRYHASPIAIGAFMLSMLTVHSIALGNVEWLVMLGLIAPAPLAILLLTIKPQMSCIAILLICLNQYKSGGIVKLSQSLVPVILATLVSFCLYGFYPASWSIASPNNATLIPAILPLALAVSIKAFRDNDLLLAFGVSPCFAPRISPQAWMGALVPFSRNQWEMLAASVGTWIIFVMR